MVLATTPGEIILWRGTLAECCPQGQIHLSWLPPPELREQPCLRMARSRSTLRAGFVITMNSSPLECQSSRGLKPWEGVATGAAHTASLDTRKGAPAGPSSKTPRSCPGASGPTTLRQRPVPEAGRTNDAARHSADPGLESGYPRHGTRQEPGVTST
jgi:hypothetical protein